MLVAGMHRVQFSRFRRKGLVRGLMADDSLSDSLNDEDLKNVSSGDDDDDDAKKPVVVGKVDYKAQKPTQLSFKKGDRIIMLSGAVNGWFEGRHEESYDEGQVPLSYTISEVEALSASNELTRKKEDLEDVLMVCKCLKDFAGKPGELSFKEHDRVEVIEKLSDKVWRCRLKGKVGTVDVTLLEEDKGFTIRKAAASKQANRDQFQNRRVKEQSSIDTKKAAVSQDLSALKREQEKLAMERDKLQKDKEAKKEARQKRGSGSFGDRVKQRSDQKKLEAAQKETQKKVEKVNAAVAAWAGEDAK